MVKTVKRRPTDTTRRRTAERRPAGRPRSETTRQAILRSAFQLLRQHGFDEVSAQQIAAHAGVSTATLYRWWSNKHAILLDAYLEKTRELLPERSRATPLERLRAYTERVAGFLKSQNGRVFLQLLMAIQEDRELYESFREKVFQPRRSEGCRVVRDAMAAGELATSLDPDFIITLLLAPQILRALLGQNVGRNGARKLFDFVIGACLADGTTERSKPAMGKRMPTAD